MLIRPLALTQLDEELGRMKLPPSLTPVRLISFGGYPAVKYFRSRKSTFDVDYVLDPALESRRDIKSAISTAIHTVAEALDCQDTWMNDDCIVFTGGHQRRVALFNATIRQNVVLWTSKHLTIYAAEWVCSLRLKLRRIEESRRQKDHDDAVCILRELNTLYGPLSKDYIRNLSPGQTTTSHIIQAYEAKYGQI